MKKIVRVICFILAFSGCVGYALDLTPKISQRVRDGIESSGVFFLDGTSKYSVTLPVETTVSGEKGEARFSFNDLVGATFVMRSSPLNGSVPFQGSELEAYRKVAFDFVPKGATDARIDKEIPNAMPQNRWTAYRFIVSSKIPGTILMQEVTFLNFGTTEQFVLVTTSVDKMFKSAAARSLLIMGSWRLLNPGDDVFTPPAG